MHYPEVSAIYQEIIGLVPPYKITENSNKAEVTTQWPLTENRKFHFGEGLARPNPLELQNYEIMEALESLS